MKTISLLQPWASLVMMGAKTIETRSWQTAYRGSLLIHASMGKRGGILCRQPPFDNYISRFDDLPFGAIIGSVTLKDIVPVEQLHFAPDKLADLTLEEKAFGDYTSGRYAWILTDPVPLESPIPIKGSLGLWHYRPQ